MEERHLSLSEAAAALDISERTAYRWIKSGKLHAYKPGRDYWIPESAIEDVVKESEVRPKESSSSLEPSLFNGLEDERRSAFVHECRYHAEDRAKHYERRLAEAHKGGVFAGHDGARVLFEEAYLEYDGLRGLSVHLSLPYAEGLPDHEAAKFSSLAVAALAPLAKTVERIADRAAELAETEAQRAEVERRRKEMRRIA